MLVFQTLLFNPHCTQCIHVIILYLILIHLILNTLGLHTLWFALYVK